MKSFSKLAANLPLNDSLFGGFSTPNNQRFCDLCPAGFRKGWRASYIGERIVNASLLAPPDRDDRCAEVISVGNMMN
jgi:hypothetical protein